MDNPVTAKFLQEFGGYDFTHPQSDRFNLLECMGDTHSGETYLLSEKGTGTLYVLKTQRDLESAAGNEAGLLNGLAHAGLPEFEKVTEHKGVRYILRKYIEGETLDAYIEKTPAVNTAEVTNVMLQLCDILEFLHSQPKPIIHRDIKPSNIIISHTGGECKVFLIDFGISRKFCENAETDTVQIITPKYAPPEQYGFAQTDCRSDIYSLGVVLRYWLSGIPYIRGAKTLAKIAAKCTEIAPAMRYQNVAALKKVFSNYKNRVRRRVTAGIAAVLTACVIFAAAIAVNNRVSEPVTPDTPQPFFEVSQEEFRELAENPWLTRTDFLRRAGEPTLTYIEGEGIKISGRIQNFFAIDLYVYTFPPGQYILEADFYSDDETTVFEIALTEGPPWGSLVSSDGGTNEATVVYNLTLVDIGGESRAVAVNQDGEQAHLRRLRLLTNLLGQYVPHPDYIIRSIRLYKQG